MKRSFLEAREALYAAGALLVVLTIGKSFFTGFDLGAKLVSTLAVGMQLYLPLSLIARRGEMPESHGIHVHGALLGPFAAMRTHRVQKRRRMRKRKRTGLDKILAYYGRGASFDGAGFVRDLVHFAVVLAVTFPPFIVGFHYYQEWFQNTDYAFSPRLPDGFVELVFTHLLVVALPEELFYRGFVQTRLLRHWPNERSILWIPIGRAVLLTSTLFALGHFLGEWNPLRLGPFIPAFMFSALAFHGRSIMGAWFYHAACNLLSAILFQSTIAAG